MNATQDTATVTAGRALADKLKAEALEELPVLLALWEAAEERTPTAA